MIKDILKRFLGCFLICAVIIGIRKLAYPESVVAVAGAVRDNIEGVIYILKLKQAAEFLASMPLALLFCLIGAVFFIFGILALKIFPRKIFLGAGIVSLNLMKVLRLGLLIYFAKFIIFMVFLYSVVGIPFLFIFETVFLLIYMFGAVLVAAALGGHIQEMANGSDRRMVYNFTIGAVFMVLCINVYAIGSTFLFFVFPVFSYGAFGALVSRRALNMQVPKIGENSKRKFDRKRMRDIITNGL